MKALRYYGRRDFRLEEVPEPLPGVGEVKVQVKCCGICGTDVHEYVEGLISVPTQRPHPQTGKVAPITGGHEFTGLVTELGGGMPGVSIGARVAVRPTLPCYQCRYCREGRLSQCSKLGTLGLSADGAFAEYVIVRQDCLVPLPDTVSFESGTYAEPLACALHAVKRSQLRPGAIVAVVGAGPIGLITLQAAQSCGAAAVYVFEPLEQRRRLAADAGATEVFDPIAGDAAKAFASLTNNMRADVVFECAGTPAAINLAESLAGRGAVLVVMGFSGDSAALPLFNLYMREKSVVCSVGYDNNDYQTAVAFLARGRVKTDALLTSSRIPLGDILAGGFEELIGPRRFDHNKILVTP